MGFQTTTAGTGRTGRWRYCRVSCSPTLRWSCRAVTSMSCCEAGDVDVDGLSPRVPIYQDTLKIGEKSKRAKSQLGRGFQRGGLKWPRVSRPEKRYARQEPPREVSGGQNGGCLEGPRQLGSPPIVAPGDGAYACNGIRAYRGGIVWRTRNTSPSWRKA